MANQHTFDIWLEYERRKRELQKQDLTPAQYENAVKRLAEHLGV